MEAGVFGFVNDAHAAGTEAFENAEVRERLADELVGAGHARDMLNGGRCGGQSTDARGLKRTCAALMRRDLRWTRRTPSERVCG